MPLGRSRPCLPHEVVIGEIGERVSEVSELVDGHGGRPVRGLGQGAPKVFGSRHAEPTSVGVDGGYDIVRHVADKEACHRHTPG
jgi:hypothetical protein